MILEAICDSDTYIWYHFFGEPGSLNDINILDRSSIVGSIFRQTFNSRVVPYVINGTTRDYMYFLVDGIYPSWSIFAKTNPNPVTDEEKYYKRRHEYVRKDIERAFGILVKKFEILDKGFRVFDLQEIKNILSVCIILHNMTVEVRRSDFVHNDLRDCSGNSNEEEDVDEDEELPNISLFGNDGDGNGDGNDDHNNALAARVAAIAHRVENAEMHRKLQKDLTHHLFHVYRKGKII